MKQHHNNKAQCIPPYPHDLQVQVIAATLNRRTNTVSPHPIEVPYESDADQVHDGVHPCGDPDCPCATYGYGVPSLHHPRLP